MEVRIFVAHLEGRYSRETSHDDQTSARAESQTAQASGPRGWTAMASSCHRRGPYRSGRWRAHAAAGTFMT